MYSSHTRKKSEMVQTAQIKLSINSNTIRSQIWISAYVSGNNWDMLHDSKTQLIQFADWQKSWKRPLIQFTDQMKKAKKAPESWKLTFHNGQYLKPSSINLASNSELVRKNLLTKLIQFADQQIAKKLANCWKKSFYVC